MNGQRGARATEREREIERGARTVTNVLRLARSTFVHVVHRPWDILLHIAVCYQHCAVVIVRIVTHMLYMCFSFCSAMPALHCGIVSACSMHLVVILSTVASICSHSHHTVAVGIILINITLINNCWNNALHWLLSLAQQQHEQRKNDPIHDHLRLALSHSMDPDRHVVFCPSARIYCPSDDCIYTVRMHNIFTTTIYSWNTHFNTEISHWLNNQKIRKMNKVNTRRDDNDDDDVAFICDEIVLQIVCWKHWKNWYFSRCVRFCPILRTVKQARGVESQRRNCEMNNESNAYTRSIVVHHCV